MSIENEYQQTIEWLYNLHLFGIKLGLKKVAKLLEYLGNPQDKLKIIHVGGTNGKGSVCSMIASVLEEAGYKVGLNTSPHLSEFTERITVNGEQITKQKVIEYGKMLGDIRERINQETELGYATYFEVVTAMALKYFYDSGVDFVVLEVGLGGTYDATNVVNPILTIITDVSLDHTEHLGNTLKSVAENKAGIIKRKIPVITSNSNQDVLDVILNKCKEKETKCYRLSVDFDYILNSSTKDGIDIDYVGVNDKYSNLKTPLIGPHQGINTSIALAAIELLQSKYNIDILKRAIFSGLLNTCWPGRLELVQKKPYVLLDGAHNPAGAKVLSESLKLFDYDKLILLFGCSEEKDIGQLLRDLAPLADRIILTKANIRRAAEPSMIIDSLDQSKLPDNDLKVEKKIPVSEAVKFALDQATKDDLICICGSLFVVGEAREMLQGVDEGEMREHRIHY
jgi:dihydrofolate synthase/folylpolyglutamate synthase